MERPWLRFEAPGRAHQFTALDGRTQQVFGGLRKAEAPAGGLHFGLGVVCHEGDAARLELRRIAEGPRPGAGTPAGRFGGAEEMATIVAFLASDDASYGSGHALVADGGYSVA